MRTSFQNWLSATLVSRVWQCFVAILIVFSAVELAYGGVAASSFAGENQKMDETAIERALETIGDSSDTLLVDRGSWTISKSITIPSHVVLNLSPGASLDIADGCTLSIDGPMDVPSVTQQIFHGKGKVRFGAGYVKEVYPQWWGKIEGEDDTVTCQAALESGAQTIRFLKATYAIDAVGDGRETGLGLQPKSNTTLLFDRGAVLQAITTDKNDYTILNIAGQENVIVDGAILRGERDAHTGEGGEWGHGLRIVKGSKNIVIRNTRVSECWGDGIYLGEGMVDGVYVEHSTFDHNRRNACSITNARNVLFTNCVFSNTDGTGPFKGVDCEPNVPEDVLQNIVFENCRSFNNVSGGFSLARDAGQDLPVSVTFRGCISENDGHGFGIDIGPSDCLGVLYINDCVVLNPKEVGFKCTSANLQTRIDGLYIVNPNQKQEQRAVFASGFVVWSAVPSVAVNRKLAGNIDANNVYILSTDDKAAYAVYVDNVIAMKGGIRDLDISVKTNMPEAKRLYRGNGPFQGVFRIKFSDEPAEAQRSDVAEDSGARP